MLFRSKILSRGIPSWLRVRLSKGKPPVLGRKNKLPAPGRDLWFLCGLCTGVLLCRIASCESLRFFLHAAPVISPAVRSLLPCGYGNYLERQISPASSVRFGRICPAPRKKYRKRQDRYSKSAPARSLFHCVSFICMCLVFSAFSASHFLPLTVSCRISGP